MPKKYWTDSYEYKRIQEILNDYWLTEPEEDKVVVKMEFYKGDQWQGKQITWNNPNRREKENEEIQWV